MVNAEKLAQQYLEDAKKHPAERFDICRKAAYSFMGLAQNPKNARAASRLSDIGLAFAHAATDGRPPTIDDFADLLKETQDAYEQVAPNGDDAMDLIARRREVHDQRTPRLSGQVYITPETFNLDVTLGRSQKIKFQPTQEEINVGILQSQTVAFWQGTKKEAQALTVDISLGALPTFDRDVDGVAFALNARAFAEVEFGSDGNRNKVILDVAEGKRVTVVGNYVAVNVGMAMPSSGNTSPVLLAGASIGVFAAPSPAPTVYTLYATSTELINPELIRAGQFSNEMPIPLKAALLLPIQTLLNVGDTMTLEWRDFGGNLIATTFYAQAVNSTMLPIPIVGDACFIRVKNTSNNATPVRLPFQLAM